ncbi:MAG: UDP-3-O-(3-hydroxymyristoyl)glucosamine N-acyltransferase [Methylophilus sp.]|nr:UDP-3-O-(3-hydroxymyristoyl)glucosamine N-acyltransferase [Methylophilus sp.]
MLTVSTIIEQLGGVLSGDGNTHIHRVGSLGLAQTGAISFFTDTKYSAALSQTLASVVIIKPEHASLTTLPKIITDNPYAYFAKVSALLNPLVRPIAGIHSSAQIGEGVDVHPNAAIGQNVVIGHHVNIAADVAIASGCVIEHNVDIGEGTVLEPNVTVRYGTKIGKHCHLYAGCVIGNDGFGYAEEHGRWVKIPQVGHVVIGDFVDIGANTTVDRGAIDDTVIEEGVKLDNLIQIAHNCRIGAHTVIAGCVGIAGSAVIGKHCKIGGAAMILGHLTIADHVTISPGSMIMRSIRQKGTYTALMPFQEHEAWLKTAANIRHLNELTAKIKALEEAINQLSPKAE